VTGFVVNHIADVFEDIKEGLESLIQMNLPDWLIGLLTGNWAVAAQSLFEGTPFEYTPAPNNNNVINTTNNDNNANITINSNQPINSILQSLPTNMMFTPISMLAFSIKK
ncbi:MAG: hypothetical protein IKY45_00695, partial [Clostridia bacterium]|nr:hypothetical protein [Clostridia bacterium]